MDQANAKNYCKSLDKRAHLVEIRTQEIQTFVEGLDLSSHPWWWMGGTDQLNVLEVVSYLIHLCIN